MPLDDPRSPSASERRLLRARERLDALINWERKGRGRMRVTLEPARDLCARLGHPERAPKVVHVTGSKGKGSVSALVQAGLEARGLRVGRYGSPHVERIHERVVVAGREVDDAALAQGIERALEAREAALAQGTAARDATWFDLLTAAAWCVFEQVELDVRVVECGLGGRFDSTNTVESDVAVVTNVELEHTNVLGATRAAIAGEKVGILKAGATLVTAVPIEDEAGAVIEARVRELGARVRRPDPGGPGFRAQNQALAAAVLDELGRRGLRGADGALLSAADLTPEVVQGAGLPGRMELRSHQGLPLVLDGAHTPGSVRSLLEELQRGRQAGLEGFSTLSGAPVVLIAVAGDKDLPGLLKSLRGGADRLVCTSVGAVHARPASEIAAAARAVDLPAETADTPRVALERCLELASPSGWILVLGSLYLAGAVRPLLEPEAPAPPAC